MILSTLKQSLVAIAIAATGVSSSALNASEERQLASKRQFPFVSVFSGDGRFENDATGAVAAIRVIPMEIRLFAKEEQECSNMVDAVLTALPNSIDDTPPIIGGIVWMRPLVELHSDHLALSTQFCAASLVIECRIDVPAHDVGKVL